jgi:hypothetical protein
LPFIVAARISDTLDLDKPWPVSVDAADCSAASEVNMDTPFSFDIALLGLSDPSPGGRSRMVLAMERLTGKSTEHCQELLGRVGQTIFQNLPVDQARLIADALDDAGAVYEIRPREDIAISVDEVPGGGMHPCPSCGYVQPGGHDECGRCGVVFSKMERDEVRKMQKDHALEEAESRAQQIVQEWDDRAKQYVESKPVDQSVVESFGASLSLEEIPFLALTSAEGPILMTSRQVVSQIDDAVVNLPYEIIKDVDYGGGLVVKKGHTRLVLHFHAPIPFRGKNVNSLTWQLDEQSATHKETIMDWSFARSYMCGHCGARELDYRNEQGVTHGRCMHCATDHSIDLRHHTITPLISR